MLARSPNFRDGLAAYIDLRQMDAPSTAPLSAIAIDFAARVKELAFSRVAIVGDGLKDGVAMQLAGAARASTEARAFRDPLEALLWCDCVDNRTPTPVLRADAPPAVLRDEARACLVRAVERFGPEHASDQSLRELHRCIADYVSAIQDQGVPMVEAAEAVSRVFAESQLRLKYPDQPPGEWLIIAAGADHRLQRQLARVQRRARRRRSLAMLNGAPAPKLDD